MRGGEGCVPQEDKRVARGHLEPGMSKSRLSPDMACQHCADLRVQSWAYPGGHLWVSPRPPSFLFVLTSQQAPRWFLANPCGL